MSMGVNVDVGVGVDVTRALHQVQKRLAGPGQRNVNRSIIFCANTLFKRSFCRAILSLLPHLFREVLESFIAEIF